VSEYARGIRDDIDAIRYLLIHARFFIINTFPLYVQEGSRGDRKEGGKRGRKPGRKAADKADMKAKLGE
jgi:hypothetical protein